MEELAHNLTGYQMLVSLGGGFRPKDPSRDGPFH